MIRLWLALLIMIRGEGDLMRFARGGGDGEGVRTWYEGERGMGDTNGMVGVLSGEGDLE